MPGATRVVLYANAGPNVGLGHAVRSAALGEALLAADAEVEVVLPPDRVATRIVKALRLPVVEQVAGGANDLAVIDSYGRWPSMGEARRISRTVARIADMSDLASDADLVIDGAPGGDRHVYAGRSLRRTFLGSEFALVPSAFLRHRGRTRQDRVIVAASGRGAEGLTHELARAAAKASGWDVDVIVGPYAGTRRDGTGIHIHQDLLPDEVAELFGQARVGVVSGGQTLIQAAATQLPCVAVIVAGNQQDQVRALEAQGALLEHCPMNAPDLYERVARALAARERFEACGVRAGAVIDGRGAGRVARALMADIEEATR